MFQSRLFGPRILRVPLATVLVISAVLGASTARAQGQPPGRSLRPSSPRPSGHGGSKSATRSGEVIKLAQAGKLDEAVAAVMKVLAIERRRPGRTARGRRRLASNCSARLQEVREDWAAARKALTEVLAIRQRQPDQKDWRIADARRALADLDRRAGLDPAQRQRLEEADQLNGLPASLFSQGKYAEGIDPCRKAMEIRGELLGENHPDYATILNNLALLYQAMGDYAKAEPLYRQALEICKRALGENHPDYATSLNNLAARVQAMGDYAKAEPLFRQALEIRKRALGETHPDYATGLNNLAVLYRPWRDYAQAEPLYRQALEIRRRLGEPPRLRRQPDNLTAVPGMGDYAKAEPP